jgi:hypothetical protein
VAGSCECCYDASGSSFKELVMSSSTLNGCVQMD